MESPERLLLMAKVGICWILFHSNFIEAKVLEKEIEIPSSSNVKSKIKPYLYQKLFCVLDLFREDLLIVRFLDICKILTRDSAYTI